MAPSNILPRFLTPDNVKYTQSALYKRFGCIFIAAVAERDVSNYKA